MVGQGRHRGCVTAWVEALVRALSVAGFLLFAALCCPHQWQSDGGNATGDVPPVDAWVFLGWWNIGKEHLRSWMWAISRRAASSHQCVFGLLVIQ